MASQSHAVQDKFDRIIHWQDNKLTAHDIFSVTKNNYSEEDVLGSYKKLSKEFHPDRLSPDKKAKGAAAFCVISDAKEFLIADLKNEFLPHNPFAQKKGTDKIKVNVKVGFQNYYNTLFKPYPNSKSFMSGVSSLMLFPLLSALVSAFLGLCALTLTISAACGFAKNLFRKPTTFEVEKQFFGRFHFVKKDLRLAGVYIAFSAASLLIGVGLELLAGIAIVCRSACTLSHTAKSFFTPNNKTEEMNPLAIVKV